MNQSSCAELGQSPLPNSIDAERALLGCLLLDNRLYDRVMDELPAAALARPEPPRRGQPPPPPYEPLFFSAAHQIIFEALARILSAGGGADLTILAGDLSARGLLESVGGAPAIAALEDDVFATGQAPEYARIIARHWRARLTIRIAREIAERAAAGEPIGGLMAAMDEAQAGDDRIEAWSVDQIFGYQVPPTHSIISGSILTEREILLIAGPAGIGKSRLINQLVFDLVLGRPDWIGLPIDRHDCSVLVIQTENGPCRLTGDIASQLRGVQPWQREEAARRIHYHVPERISDRMVGLANPGNRERLRRLVLKHRPNVVIFDPYGDFFAGENQNDEMQTRQTVQHLQQVAQAASLSTAIVIVHHAQAGKAGAAKADGWDRSTFAKGNKALVACARSMINIAPAAEDDTSRLAIICGKNNNGPMFQTFGVRLDPDTMRYEVDPEFDHGAWREAVSDSKPAHGGGRAKKVSDDAIRLVLRDGAKNFKQLKELIIEISGCGSRTSINAINSAVDRGVINKGGGLYSIPFNAVQFGAN
jgi:hypothetical protein